jgi:hypothetical protein
VCRSIRSAPHEEQWWIPVPADFQWHHDVGWLCLLRGSLVCTVRLAGEEDIDKARNGSLDIDGASWAHGEIQERIPHEVLIQTLSRNLKPSFGSACSKDRNASAKLRSHPYYYGSSDLVRFIHDSVPLYSLLSLTPSNFYTGYVHCQRKVRSAQRVPVRYITDMAMRSVVMSLVASSTRVPALSPKLHALYCWRCWK